MSLNSTQCAANIFEGYQSVIAQEVTDFPLAFANAYHDYASLGVIPGAVSGGGDKGIIETFMRSVTSTPSMVDDMAQMFADYWAGVGLVPAPPNVSSVNNSSSLFSSYRQAIINSITQSDTQPYFNHFIANIETVVKSITWTITDNNGNTFTSNIS